ncbi:MAG: glycosyltransferase, partial [Bacteroidia bacterium]|nr:glycosyltransferase [Bacteroidia bacterium]
MNSNPAIVVSAYNRPHALQRLLHSIAAAHYESRDITLIISIDQSESGSVNAIAENFRWEHG